MSDSMKYNKIWDVVEFSAGVISLALWFALMALWWGYAHTRPTMPAPYAGRIYALTEYGVTVYLTKPERNYLYMLGAMSVLLFLVVMLVSIVIKKSLRRPEPWENRS